MLSYFRKQTLPNRNLARSSKRHSPRNSHVTYCCSCSVSVISMSKFDKLVHHYFCCTDDLISWKQNSHFSPNFYKGMWKAGKICYCGITVARRDKYLSYCVRHSKLCYLYFTVKQRTITCCTNTLGILLMLHPSYYNTALPVLTALSAFQE